MLDLVVIANRGEIALRIIRALAELNIKWCLTHSTVDENSLPVIITKRMGQDAICIGPGPAPESYLNPSRIMGVLEILTNRYLGAKIGLHPGYGFLAENSLLPVMVNDLGITFIGPPANTMEALSDKVKARKIAEVAKVPIIPGSDGIVLNRHDAQKIANKIGYPVLLKAKNGGGGRGIRLVKNEKEFSHEFDLAQGEARQTFGNSDLLIEKYLENPRHIEIQIAADQFGNIITLGERDCSLQNSRHQKLIEETPAPNLNQKIRLKLFACAIKLAKTIAYQNLATVEFLVTPEEKYYFLEMNMRLQVEHPITEMVTGIDLVKLQILIAAGEKLPWSRKDISLRGHSIECRLPAEDPECNFQPNWGVITNLIWPGGLGVRVDSHLYQGYQVPPYYDPLMGKIIVWAENRELAIRKMRQALSETVITGIKTPIPLYQKILISPQFIAGDLSTTLACQLNT